MHLYRHVLGKEDGDFLSNDVDVKVQKDTRRHVGIWEKLVKQECVSGRLRK